jgi:hypothetical protein
LVYFFAILKGELSGKEFNKTTSKMIVTPETIQNFSKILNGEPIQEFVLWIDENKESELRSLFDRFSIVYNKLTTHWVELFKDPIELESLIGRTDSEAFLKEKYIVQEGFQKKLPFVKREKLIEIVDFPDFSGLLSQISIFSFTVKEARDSGFSLEDLLEVSEYGLSEEIEARIISQSQEKIEGWESSQKYIYIVLYVDSLNKMRRHVKHSLGDLNRYFLRQGFLITYNQDELKIDLEKLKIKLDGVN